MTARVGAGTTAVVGSLKVNELYVSQGWAIVQSAKADAVAAANPTSITFTSTVGSGNCVVGCIQFDGFAGAVLNSVTDDKGNTYNRETAIQDASGQWLAAFSLGNITNGPKTLSFNFNAAPGSAATSIVIEEIFGALAVSDPRDVHGGRIQNAVGQGTDVVSSGSFTTTLANEF